MEGTMKMMKLLIVFSLLCGASVFAADIPQIPVEAVITVDQFLGQVLETIRSFGGMPWTLKVAAIIMILVSSMKVSFLRPLWDKLGAFKVLASLVLSLIAGVLTLGVGPESITFQGIVAYLFAGAGSIVLHELLDVIKSLPGVGQIYTAAIEFIQRFLKKPEPKIEA